jgi:hypothetical protein
VSKNLFKLGQSDLQQSPPSSHSSHPTKCCDYFQDLESGLWYEVGGKAARDKVGQALRDAMKVLKKRDSVEQTGDDINLRTNKIILKKRPYVEQTEDDINPRSNKKICGVSERSIVVDTPNKKYASGLSRSDCSSMQYKQPSTPIFESLVGVSALEEIATKNRTSCADEQEIKNDEEGEVTDLLQHLPSSSPLLCTKEQQVPYSGMVTVVSDSVKGKNSTTGSCSFHIEAVAFNTTATSSVWSKDLSEITLQTSSSAKHHHQEESCQKNAIIYSENVFLDPFEEDLEPVPLGPSGVVLGTSALLVAPSGPRCRSMHEKSFVDCGFHPMMSRAPASVLTRCGDDRTTSPLASFLLAKRNGYNEAVAIMNDNLRPLDSFSTFV